MSKSGDEVVKLVGRRIREIREHRGWTQSQLGEKLGKTQNTISQYENAATRMRISEIADFAQALNVPITHFFGESPVEDELMLVDEILLDALRISAKTTILRCLDLHYSLYRIFHNSDENSDQRMALLVALPDVSNLYSEFREDLISLLKKYHDQVTYLYHGLNQLYPEASERFAVAQKRVDEDTDALLREIESGALFTRDSS